MDRHSKSLNMKYNTSETKEYTDNNKGGGENMKGNQY